MGYKNPEDKRANGLKYRAEHRKEIAAKSKAWRQANKARCDDYYKRRNLKGKYGITLEEYNGILAKQNGCCAICGVHQSEVKHVFHVDHNHETKQVRGILCFCCNVALGNVKDNVDTLKTMVKYLEVEEE